MESIGLRSLQNEIVDWVGDAFNGQEEQLRAVTLTFRPSLAFRGKESLRSADLRVFLKRLNTRVYGKSYKNGQLKLKCFPVFEHNLQEGVHVHMFLGIPSSAKVSNEQFDELVITEWQKMDCAGVKAAQDVRACNDIGGWAEYITKRIQCNNALSFLDVENITIQ